MPRARLHTSSLKQYALAVALTLALGNVQLLLLPAWGGRFPFLLFFPAIIVASLAGGRGPGLLALVIAVLYSGLALLSPSGSLMVSRSGDRLALVIFAVIGALTALGGDRVRRSRSDADLARRALEESEARLAGRDVSKDRFLAVLAHELRQPLQAIAMASRALAAADSDRARISGVIDRQVQQLTRLVSDLNDLTRIKEGRVHFEQIPFDLREAVEAAAESHRDVLAQRKVHFDVRAGDAPLPVLGDKARMQQVFSNLLHNALHATPAGGAVHVAVRRDSQLAVIVVRDTGVGIAPERLPDMFSLVAEDGQGGSAHNGVGLALVQSIVIRHGGTVHVRSDGHGRGAEFEVRLPCTTR